MKVRDLIRQLSSYNSDMEVVIALKNRYAIADDTPGTVYIPKVYLGSRTIPVVVIEATESTNDSG